MHRALGQRHLRDRRRIHQETGDGKLKIASIGPAGEARSLLAGIVNEKGRIAARSGVGAVMGSKNLKAVAVKGGTKKSRSPTGKVERGEERFLSVIRSSEFAKGLSAAGTGGALELSPVHRRFPRQKLADDRNGIHAAQPIGSTAATWTNIKRAVYSCQACPIRCGAIIEQKEGRFAVPGEMHRPEYETLVALGSLLVNDNQEAVIKANDICNRFGIDTISTGTAIAFAMECYENGLISKDDTDGMNLSGAMRTRLLL